MCIGDLGCSLGAGLAATSDGASHVSARLIGVDSRAAMLRRWRAVWSGTGGCRASPAISAERGVRNRELDCAELHAAVRVGWSATW